MAATTPSSPPTVHAWPGWWRAYCSRLRNSCPWARCACGVERETVEAVQRCNVRVVCSGAFCCHRQHGLCMHHMHRRYCRAGLRHVQVWHLITTHRTTPDRLRLTIDMNCSRVRSRPVARTHWFLRAAVILVARRTSCGRGTGAGLGGRWAAKVVATRGAQRVIRYAR